MFGFRAWNGTGGRIMPFLRTQKECEDLRALFIKQEAPAVISACESAH